MSIATKAGCEEQKEIYIETCLWTSAQDTQKHRVEQKSICLKSIT